jgi:hypothetical protein
MLHSCVSAGAAPIWRWRQLIQRHSTLASSKKGSRLKKQGFPRARYRKLASPPHPEKEEALALLLALNLDMQGDGQGEP